MRRVPFKPLALVGALLLSACGHPAIPKTDAEKLIRQSVSTQCELTQFFFQPVGSMGADRTPAGDAVTRWLLSLRATAGYQKLGQEEVSHALLGHTVVYRYAGPDGSLVNWASFESYDHSSAYAVSADACLYRSTGVEVLDTTMDKDTGKKAIVVFRKQLAGSAPLQDLRASSAGSYLNAGVVAPHPEQKFQAVLQKLDATGWQVISTAPLGS